MGTPKTVVTCRGKYRYISEAKAKTSAKTIVTAGREGYLRAYECPRCNGWHLTKKPLPNTDVTETVAETVEERPMKCDNRLLYRGTEKEVSAALGTRRIYFCTKHKGWHEMWKVKNEPPYF